ncbi:MAG: YceD family protein [Turicibacter sp.]|nr:YceD family protein [Turicibacter sp.]
MKWQIARLLKESTKKINIEEDIDFSDAVKRNPDIRSMTKIKVTGVGTVFTTERRMAFDLTIKGEMTLACALTLDDVNYPFQATLAPAFVWDSERHDELSEDYLVKDTIELASAIWQEIFIQIPLRVIKDGAYEELASKGIEVLSEEEVKEEAKNQIDPRFAALEGLKFED